ncbi:MAG: hypothetical protein ACR2GU_11005 [Rubrobacteraceae bacterium]|jgi:hypothetical protein
MKIEALISEFSEHLSDDEHTSPRTAEFYEVPGAVLSRLTADTGETVSEIADLHDSDLDLEATQIRLGGPNSYPFPAASRSRLSQPFARTWAF